MSKIAIGIAVRLAARWDGRGIEDLVARETNNARDDDLIGDEEVDRELSQLGLDPLAAEIGLQLIDKGRAGGGRRARRREQDANVPSGRGPWQRAYRRHTRGPIVCTRVAAPLIASTIRRSVKSLTGRGRSLGS